MPTPSRAARSESGSARSLSTNSTPGALQSTPIFSWHIFTFGLSKAGARSVPRTGTPFSASIFTMWPPEKPQAPVTSAGFISVLPS